MEILVSECLYLYGPLTLHVALYPFKPVWVFLLPNPLIDLRAQLLGSLQSFSERASVCVAIWGVLQDLTKKHSTGNKLRDMEINIKQVVGGIHVVTYKQHFSAYIFDEKRVTCNPLHGLEEEAGQRHSFTAIVSCNLLLKGRQTEAEIFYCISQKQVFYLFSPLLPFTISIIQGSYFEEVFKVRLVVGLALQQGCGVELAGAEANVWLHVCELRRQQVSY